MLFLSHPLIEDFRFCGDHEPRSAHDEFTSSLRRSWALTEDRRHTSTPINLAIHPASQAAAVDDYGGKYNLRSMLRRHLIERTRRGFNRPQLFWFTRDAQQKRSSCSMGEAGPWLPHNNMPIAWNRSPHEIYHEYLVMYGLHWWMSLCSISVDLYLQHQLFPQPLAVDMVDNGRNSSE